MKNKSVSTLAGGAVLLVLAFLLRFLSQSSPVLLALSMAAGVSGITVLVCFVLGLIHPKSHRARTILALLNSLLRYAAALVILCWGLSILGVDVSVIVASVGVVTLVVGFGVESLIADVSPAPLFSLKISTTWVTLWRLAASGAPSKASASAPLPLRMLAAM